MLKVPDNIMNLITELTTKAYDLLGDRIKKIMLYGSYARGDYNKDSDIDIMILTDLTDEEIIEYRDKISGIAFDIEFDNGFDVTISPLIKNIDKFNSRINIVPFYMNVQKDGIELNFKD